MKNPEVRSTYVLTVQNRSVMGISDIHITGPGVDICIKSLGPGETQTCKSHIKGDGELVFSAKLHGSELSGIIEDYVTGGPVTPRDKKLIFKDNGEYEIEGQVWTVD